MTLESARLAGISAEKLRWGVKSGTWQKAGHGLYVPGPDPVLPIERALGVAIATGGVVSHSLAGILYGLDSVKLTQLYVSVPAGMQSKRSGVRSRQVDRTDVDGCRCTTGTQTMVDLAAVLDDLKWEQALESALRKKLTTIADIEAELPRLGSERASGTTRIRRVLAVRPIDAPHTDSLLETLFIQLLRLDRSIPAPARQVEVRSEWGTFVARVDIAWPEFGVFVELDGQQHKDQPIYDARRQTAVVATTRWLPARFTWYEVTSLSKSTLRRVSSLLSKSQKTGTAV